VSATHAGSSLTAMNIPSTPLFPPKVIRWLRYATNSTTVTATSGIPSSYIFRANGCVDIDVTSTGHQPMGFDQMMVSFNHFAVKRSIIRCTARNVSANVATAAVRLDASVTALTDKDRIQEYGGAVVETLEAKGVYGANQKMSLDVSIPRVQGISNSAFTADTSLRGDASTDPSELSYFHCVLWDSTGLTSQCTFDVVIDQQVIFTEPRTLTISSELSAAVAYLKAMEGLDSLHTSRFEEAVFQYRKLHSSLREETKRRPSQEISHALDQEQLRDELALASSLGKLTFSSVPVAHPPVPDGWIAVRK
jgi:hypothetical protein